jgi:outer membrane murein-binding lipoprotein Lpp
MQQAAERTRIQPIYFLAATLMVQGAAMTTFSTPGFAKSADVAELERRVAELNRELEQAKQELAAVRTEKAAAQEKAAKAEAELTSPG